MSFYGRKSSRSYEKNKFVNKSKRHVLLDLLLQCIKTIFVVSPKLYSYYLASLGVLVMCMAYSLCLTADTYAYCFCL